MSTLWTPGGEHPVGRDRPGAQDQSPPAPGRPAGPPPAEPTEPTEEEARAAMAELRDRLAGTPAEVVIANHAYGLFELAALHLSLERPQLDEARLAIDALGALVEGMGARLGQAAAELSAGLGQLRLAYVQVQAAAAAGPATGQD